MRPYDLMIAGEMQEVIPPREQYRRLLRAAVRYFALSDSAELCDASDFLSDKPGMGEELFREFWWRHRSPLLVAGAFLEAEDNGWLFLPPRWRDRLESLLVAGGRRHRLLVREFDRIAEKSSVQLIPLKGMWLSEAVYPLVWGCATRLSGDVDIAVPVNRLNDVEEAMRVLGCRGELEPNPLHRNFWRPCDFSLWEGLPRLDRPTNISPEVLEQGEKTLWIEIHVRNLDYYCMAGTPLDLEAHPADAVRFVHILTHLATHLYAHPNGFVDAALMFRQLPELADDAPIQQFGVERHVAAVAGIVAAQFGDDLLPSNLGRFRRHPSFVRGQQFGGWMDIPSVRWRGGRLAWHCAGTATSKRLVARETAQDILDRLVPRGTLLRRALRSLRLTLSRRKTR